MERILYTWLEVSEMMDERSVEVRSEGARENYILHKMLIKHIKCIYYLLDN